MKNKIILMLAMPIFATLGLHALAIDPDYSFREGVRSQVQSNLFSDAVNMPGTLSVTSNVGVGGALLVTGNQTNTGSIQANGGIVIPATAGAVALGTNVTATGIKLHAPSFPLTGGSTTLGTNVILSGVTIPTTSGPINMGTNVIHTGAFTGTIDATSKCTVVNGVITAQGI